jgi:hypothetical protein
LQVEEHQVRLERGEPLESLLPVFGLAHDHDVRKRFQFLA